MRSFVQRKLLSMELCRGLNHYLPRDCDEKEW
jgi:hypothetical protein